MPAELITGYDKSFAPLAALTVPVMRGYAERHGLHFSVFEMKAIDRPIAWSAILAMKEALARGADPAIWIDIDALIVRPDLDIRNEMQPGKDLFCVRNTHGGFPELGIWLLRNSEWSRWVLDAMWDNRLIPEHTSWHQAALCKLAGLQANLGRGEPDKPNEEILSHVGWIDSRWNTLDNIKRAPEAYIRHFAGMSLARKIGCVRRELSPVLGTIVCHLVWHEERMASKAKTNPGIHYRLRRDLARAALKFIDPHP